MANYSSSVLIEELGDERQVLRAIELRGPALPHAPAEWGGENAMTTTWYAGNPDDATQQFMVAKLAPSQWQGCWRLTQMTRMPSKFTDIGAAPRDIKTPQTLRDLVEDFATKGRRLRVTWIVNSEDAALRGRVVREGRVSSFKFPHHGTADIEWNIEFAWASKGEKSERVSAAREDNVKSATAALQAAMDVIQKVAISRINTSKAEIPGSATVDTLGQLEALANYPQELVDGISRSSQRVQSQLGSVTELITAAKDSPFVLAGALVEISRDSVRVLNDFTDAISSVPSELTTLKDDAASVIRAARDYGAVQDAVEIAAKRARELGDSAANSTGTNAGRGEVTARSSSSTKPGSLIAIRIVHEGDTPESLALEFYGTPDAAMELLRANRLPFHQTTLTPGTILIIPELQSVRRTA